MQDIHIHVTHHNFPARSKHVLHFSWKYLISVLSQLWIHFIFSEYFHIEVGLHTAQITGLKFLFADALSSVSSDDVGEQFQN